MCKRIIIFLALFLASFSLWGQALSLSNQALIEVSIIQQNIKNLEKSINLLQNQLEIEKGISKDYNLLVIELQTQIDDLKLALENERTLLKKQEAIYNQQMIAYQGLNTSYRLSKKLNKVIIPILIIETIILLLRNYH